MPRNRAILVTLVVMVVPFVFVCAWLGNGWPAVGKVPPGRELRAAVAIRDNVTPFQKWGTQVFTWRYLERYYGAAWYFTQAGPGREDQREAFLACLDRALARYPAVDLYLLAHTNKYVAWVEDLPEEHRRHLRLVYNTGCHNLPQGQRWIGLGAKAYVGHPGESTSSVFYYYFLWRWMRGATIREAADESNALMVNRFRETEALTLGWWTAESLARESWASCRGNGGIRLEDCRE